MTPALFVLQSAADKFADTAIDWIFAIGVVVFVVVAVFRWIESYFED